jgi:hypothetical protein
MFAISLLEAFTATFIELECFSVDIVYALICCFNVLCLYDVIFASVCLVTWFNKEYYYYYLSLSILNSMHDKLELLAQNHFIYKYTYIWIEPYNITTSTSLS